MPIDSMHIDTVGRESIIIPESFDEMPVDSQFSFEEAFIFSEFDDNASDSAYVVTAQPDPASDWREGLEGSSRQNFSTGQSAVITIVTVILVVLCLNFKECRRLYSRFFDQLTSNKKRENAFDEHTNHESRFTCLTVIQYIIFGGIILCGAALDSHGNLNNYLDDFSSISRIISIFAAYYVFDIAAYSILGYAFAGKEGCHKILRAFNASQSLAGALLIIPAIMLLFYPATIYIVSILALFIYLIARLLFIYKEFSIFYQNIFSLLYFILYLCTLEIIPVIYIYQIACLAV